MQGEVTITIRDADGTVIREETVPLIFVREGEMEDGKCISQ